MRYTTESANTEGYYKIKINGATHWMLSFVLRIYQNYKMSDIMISGYNYENYYWYSPQALMISSTDSISIPIYFGYDSVFNLWIAFPCNIYSGIGIFNVVNGYKQVINSNDDLFTITYESSLSGTIQTIVNAYRPNISYGTSSMTPGSTALPTGEIYLQYS